MRHMYPLRDESLQVLAALVKFGTCSVQTLARITHRNANRVHRTVCGLAEKGLITRLTVAVSGTPAVHVQVASTPSTRSTVSRLLGISENELPKRGFPISQLAHEDRCARMHLRIAQSCPSYVVVRDWEMHRGQIPESVLPKSFHRDGFIPDLMIGIPGAGDSTKNTTQNSQKWIAVELDRTRKKLDRLREKLHLYARETQIDGLLYVLPEWSLVNSLGRYFDESVVPRTIRIRDLKDVFLARTLLGEEDREASEMKLLCANQVTTFAQWSRLIETTSSRERAEVWRELVGSHPPNSFFENNKPSD